MVQVRGNDPYVGVEFAQQGSAWITAATTGFIGAPLVSESLVLERDSLAVPKELGQTGYREFFEYGPSFVRGSMTVLGRYDARFWNMLLAHAFYSETLVQDSWVDGTVLSGSTAPGNAHIYAFSSTLPYGLTIRAHKGGQSAGKYDEFVGCMVGSFTLDQPENDVLRMTFNFLGYTMTTNTQTGVPAAVGGVVPIRVRDYGPPSSGTQYSYVKVGNASPGPATLNIKGFRINVDRKLEFDTAFLNNLDSRSQPGIVDVRDITIELNGTLENDYGAAGRPATEYLSKTSSTCDIILCADIATTSNRLYTAGNASYRPYAMRLEFPKTYWTRVPTNIQSGGANDLTYSVVAVKGDFDASGSLPDAQQGDFRAIVAVKQTDEPSVDSKFSSL